jgi:hypothetical protein
MLVIRNSVSKREGGQSARLVTWHGGAVDLLPDAVTDWRRDW